MIGLVSSPRSRHARSVTGFAFALGLSLAASASVGASNAAAAEPLSTEGRANQLFASGEKKFDGGDYTSACADFSESLKLGPKLGTLLNLALCHETIGKLVTAWSEFSHGAAWAAQNNQKDRLEFATTHIRSLEPRLPRIVLQLPADRAIESLDLDGEPVPEQRWYLPLYLDPGEHHLGAMAPGKKRASVVFRVTLSPTDQLVMVPNLTDDDHAIAAATARAHPDPFRRPLGCAALTLGLAGLALGTTFGILSATSDTAHAAKTDGAVATASFLAGAAFSAAGVWLLWTHRIHSARASVSPQAGGGGLRLEAGF